MSADDDRLARALRELRRRASWTQDETARKSGISVRMLRKVERGEATEVPGAVLMRAFDPFGARVRISVWWQGAELDRVLDEAHVAVVEQVINVVAARGWKTAAEVTFSEYGERGSVDVLCLYPETRCAHVVEVKASWGSLEATNRSLDTKLRLGPKLVRDRFGVSPISVSRLLVLPDDRTLRRVAERHAETLNAVYPLRSREIRAWLRRPTGSASGLWFLSFRAESKPKERRRPG